MRQNSVYGPAFALGLVLLGACGDPVEECNDKCSECVADEICGAVCDSPETMSCFLEAANCDELVVCISGPPPTDD